MEPRPFSNRQMHIETVRRAHCLFSNRQIRIRSVCRPRRNFFFRQVKAAGNPLWIPEDLYAAGRKRGKRAACRGDVLLPEIKQNGQSKVLRPFEMDHLESPSQNKIEYSTPQKVLRQSQGCFPCTQRSGAQTPFHFGGIAFPLPSATFESLRRVLIVSAPLYLFV